MDYGRLLANRWTDRLSRLFFCHAPSYAHIFHTVRRNDSFLAGFQCMLSISASSSLKFNVFPKPEGCTAQQRHSGSISCACLLDAHI
jgi:hypothetical protein